MQALCRHAPEATPRGGGRADSAGQRGVVALHASLSLDPKAAWPSLASPGTAMESPAMGVFRELTRPAPGPGAGAAAPGCRPWRRGGLRLPLFYAARRLRRRKLEGMPRPVGCRGWLGGDSCAPPLRCSETHAEPPEFAQCDKATHDKRKGETGGLRGWPGPDLSGNQTTEERAEARTHEASRSASGHDIATSQKEQQHHEEWPPRVGTP